MLQAIIISIEIHVEINVSYDRLKRSMHCTCATTETGQATKMAWNEKCAGQWTSVLQV